MRHWFAPERFETSAFVLRPYDAGDGALLADAHAESYEHLRPWLPWAKPETPLDEAEILVRRFRAKYLTHEDFVVGVFSPDERRLLGGTGFHPREGPLAGGCAEMGLFVRASEARKGLGTLVISAMLEWGFDAWPWLRLSWRCDDRNVGSVRVAEKVGLRFEGLLRGQAAEVGGGSRDTAWHGLAKDAWLARRG